MDARQGLSQDTRKYIFENGLMKLNPHFGGAQNNVPSTVAVPSQALAIVSSTQDILASGIQMSEATKNSMEIMQDPSYVNQLRATDGGTILDGLSAIFNRYEVPIGMTNKLLMLTEYNLNFIIDNSGTMMNPSDVKFNTASQYIKDKCRSNDPRFLTPNAMLTRWEEAEERIHIMIDMLAFVPTGPINFTFLNPDSSNGAIKDFVLDHTNKTPEEFAKYAHAMISEKFRSIPSGPTPLYEKLNESFTKFNKPTVHYVLTDGEPTFYTKEDVKSLVMNRNASRNPINFITCTGDNAEVQWIKDIDQDESKQLVAEIDDFVTESAEVLKSHGPKFPFSRGLWLMCQLVAAINPHDLDKLDEPKPFSKFTLDNLMGRVTSAIEYQEYFRLNPNAHRYNNYFNRLSTEPYMAYQILSTPPGSAPIQSQYVGQGNSQFSNQPPFTPQAQTPAYNPQVQTPAYNPQSQNPAYNSQAQNPVYNPQVQGNTWNYPQNQPAPSAPPATNWNQASAPANNNNWGQAQPAPNNMGGWNQPANLQTNANSFFNQNRPQAPQLYPAPQQNYSANRRT
ncbi:MAG: hypothetical protein H0W64_05385 [Gammaproteobacteria bacterium]|nr:hypothetical protein [Gammaproteobacteria bacterium]